MIRFAVDSDIPLDEAYVLYQVVGMVRERKREQWEREMARTAFYLTARRDGALVGLARAVTSGLMGAGIWDVMVHPDHRGLGIGSRLVSMAVDELLRRDAKDIALQCEGSLEPFYEALGFVRGPWGMHYGGVVNDPGDDGFYS